MLYVGFYKRKLLSSISSALYLPCMCVLNSAINSAVTIIINIFPTQKLVYTVHYLITKCTPNYNLLTLDSWVARVTVFTCSLYVVCICLILLSLSYLLTYHHTFSIKHYSQNVLHHIYTDDGLICCHM